MKDMTDRELLDAMDRAMKTVARQFREKREAEERAAAKAAEEASRNAA